MASKTESLKRISERCHAVLHRIDDAFPQFSSKSTHTRALADIQPIHCSLPYPAPIATILFGEGISTNLADSISLIYLRNALRLKLQFEEQLKQLQEHNALMSVDDGRLVLSSIGSRHISDVLRIT